MNSFNGIGNLVADVDYKISPSGTAVSSFRVAIRRDFKNQQTGEYESDFLTCKAFGKTAEIIANNFRKGSKIGINGKVQTGSYENQQGVKVYTTDIIVNNITFIDKKSDGSQNQQNYQQNTNYQAPPQNAPQQYGGQNQQYGQQNNGQSAQYGQQFGNSEQFNQQQPNPYQQQNDPFANANPVHVDPDRDLPF